MKGKIINDPVHGFITVPDGLIAEVLQHPFVQRLKRIKQLGLTEFVYPGANHTRFHHALGVMHLTSVAIEVLQNKGVDISGQEAEAVKLAGLLHDVGHGPFSHTLEYTLLDGVHHETVSSLMIQHLNEEFEQRLTLAAKIFNNDYKKKFLYQLISNQIDTDRLDYLKRDAYFTGVSEGNIGAGRMIKMFAVHGQELVIEQKGIYSIEQFLSARRMMYWQVYMHKTTVATEQMLVQLIKRARQLALQGILKDMPSASLRFFLENEITANSFANDDKLLHTFANLDDYDIWASIKHWQNHEDAILKYLSLGFINRNLFRIILSDEPISTDIKQQIIEQGQQKLSSIPTSEWQELIVEGCLSNSAYTLQNKINILTKEGILTDVAQASDLPYIEAMSHKVDKYFICFPREIKLSLRNKPTLFD